MFWSPTNHRAAARTKSPHRYSRIVTTHSRSPKGPPGTSFEHHQDKGSTGQGKTPGTRYPPLRTRRPSPPPRPVPHRLVSARESCSGADSSRGRRRSPCPRRSLPTTASAKRTSGAGSSAAPGGNSARDHPAPATRFAAAPPTLHDLYLSLHGRRHVVLPDPGLPHQAELDHLAPHAVRGGPDLPSVGCEGCG